MDRVRNEEVRRRIGATKELAGQAKHSVLLWFEYMEKMKEDLLMKRIVGSDVRCDVERKVTNVMNGRCEKSIE